MFDRNTDDVCFGHYHIKILYGGIIMKKMKNAVCLVLSVVCLTLLASMTVLADENIRVYFNDVEISFDTQPKIVNNTILVPMRNIFEILGYEVQWYDESKCILATKDDNAILMNINGNIMVCNNKSVDLDVAPQIVDGNTIVPLRAISEISGYTVSWDDRNRVVVIGETNNISYYDATNEVNQIKSFIRSGLYLEAMENCQQTLDWHNLSDEDIQILNSLYDEANNKYADYLEYEEELNRTIIVTNEAGLTREAINNARNNLGIPKSLTVKVYSGYWYWEGAGKNVIGINFYSRNKEIAWCDVLNRDGSLEMKYSKYSR